MVSGVVMMTGWVSSFLLPSLLTRGSAVRPCLCASLTLLLLVLLLMLQQQELMPCKSLFGGRSVERQVVGDERQVRTLVRVELEEEKEWQDEQDEEPGGRGALQPGASRRWASWTANGCSLDHG